MAKGNSELSAERGDGPDTFSFEPSPAPLVRTACGSDVDALLMLARKGGDGLTNLPPDRKALAAKLKASEDAIKSADAREAGAAILLIIELAGNVVGTSCIFPRVGADWPFYSYRLTRQVSRSLAVEKRKAQTLLNLVNDFDGECEVGGLFVDPDCRGHAIGKLAAKARYLFIAAHRDWFARKVIAELRGYQDEAGNSPVWDAIGRHFYEMEFSEADRTGALSGNQFIADLGPRYPLYISMLPPPAQEALGRPHNDGRPAHKMLLNEGFVDGEYVDIFDGGPTLFANIDDVKSVRETKTAVVDEIGDAESGEYCLIATGHGPDFKVTRGHLLEAGIVTPETAAALDLHAGQSFHYLAI